MDNEQKNELINYITESRDLSQLLAGLAHELRLPLTPIAGFSSLLLMVEQGKAATDIVRREQDLQAIKNASNYIDELITAIREIEKLPQYKKHDTQPIVGMTQEIYGHVKVIDGYSTLLLMMEQGKADSDAVNREEALQKIKGCSDYIGEIITAMYEFAQQIENTNPKE